MENKYTVYRFKRRANLIKRYALRQINDIAHNLVTLQIKEGASYPPETFHQRISTTPCPASEEITKRSLKVCESQIGLLATIKSEVALKIVILAFNKKYKRRSGRVSRRDKEEAMHLFSSPSCRGKSRKWMYKDE